MNVRRSDPGTYPRLRARVPTRGAGLPLIILLLAAFMKPASMFSIVNNRDPRPSSGTCHASYADVQWGPGRVQPWAYALVLITGGRLGEHVSGRKRLFLIGVTGLHDHVGGSAGGRAEPGDAHRLPASSRARWGAIHGAPGAGRHPGHLPAQGGGSRPWPASA